MNNKKFDVYLDFGSSKIRIAAFSKDNINNNIYMESICHSNLAVNKLDFSSSEIIIEKMIFDLEKKTNEYLDSVNIMIDSPDIFPINLSVLKNYTGHKLKNEDIKFLIQDAKQQILKNYPSQDIIHIIVQNYKIDNVDYNFLPLEINCNTISADITFICLPKKIIKDLKKLFAKINIYVNQISISSYAKSLSYKDNFNLDENIIFIDMGFNKTSIIYYKKNNIIFVNILPIGGNHITKDLSKVLSLDLINAEKLKLSFDTDKNTIINEVQSHELVQKIIIARIEEILELSIKPVELSINLEKNFRFKIILMGEGSKILDNKFKNKISFKEEIDLLDETIADICGSALKLNKRINKQEVVIVPKKPNKIGFFEKLFLFFN